MFASLYPRAHAWLSQLPPAGLDAYPQCTCNTRLPRAIAAQYPQLVDLPHLTAPCLRALHAPMPEGGWLPETMAMLQYLILRDAMFTSDAVFLAATKARIKDSFLHPSIRPLMALMSPHLLILGAGARWSRYHRGSALTVSSSALHSLSGTLTFPPGLFAPLMVEDTRVAVGVSIEMTGKVLVTNTATPTAPGEYSIAATWR